MPRPLILLALALLSVSPAGAQAPPFAEDTTSVLTRAVGAWQAAFWIDYDGDGDLDLYVSSGDPTLHPDLLYTNAGHGRFLIRFASPPYEAGAGGGVNGGGWLDVEGDGVLDFVASSLTAAALEQSTGGTPPYLFHVFSALNAYTNVRDVVAADYDRDGDPDLVIARQLGYEEALLRNTEGTFDQNPNTFDVDATTACWGDADGDGWQEVLITATGGEHNRLFRNNRGALTSVTLAPVTTEGMNSEGCNWADYDGDGDLDLFVANAGLTGQPNRLYRNDGTTFVQITTGPVAEDVHRTFGSAWGDVDNDGDLDLAVANRNAPEVLYLNDGHGGFTATPFGLAADGWSLGVTLVDDDGDGDLDLFVANGGPLGAPTRNRLFRNTTGTAGHWLEVDLRGKASDWFGLGARVTAYATIGGVARALVREVTARSGRMAQDGFRLHFGLGDAAEVDSLVVQWPASDPQVLYGVAAGALVVVEEPGRPTGAVAPVPVGQPTLRAYPNPSTDLMTVVASGLPDGPVRVEVLDVVGRRVGAMEGASLGGVARLAWDGGTVAAGPYTLRLTGASDVAPVRVVIAR